VQLEVVDGVHESVVDLGLLGVQIFEGHGLALLLQQLVSLL